jgi:hypothetical protein
MNSEIARFVVTHDVNEGNSPANKTGAGGFEKFVIGIVILGIVAGLIYQVFFCSTCYGLTQRFVPTTEKTDPK